MKPKLITLLLDGPTIKLLIKVGEGFPLSITTKCYIKYKSWLKKAVGYTILPAVTEILHCRVRLKTEKQSTESFSKNQKINK